MSDVQTRLGTRVRDLRTRRAWTQEALGERAGLSYKFIGEIERGSGNPTVDSIAQIARAFGVDVGELFRREAPEMMYTPLTADDFAVVRDTRQHLTSLEDVMKRLDASARPKAKKRSRGR